MKKFISIAVLICMLILPMATVNAVDSDHPYVDENPSILNQDLFKETFSVDEVDRVAYNYQLTPLEGGERASVAFQMKVVIDGVPYTTSTIGCINAYALPESDVLWEGPIDGEITINNIHFNIIIGFMQKASTQEVMVSVTLQNDDYDFMVISFGKNIMTGDVLDCINQRFGTPSSSESVSGTNGVQSGQLNINDGGNASTNAFDSDFSPITYPGSGGGLPGDGGGGGGATLDIVTDVCTWKFQNRSTKYFGEVAYPALQSRVYFDDSRNILMITLRTYTENCNKYTDTLLYDYAPASLQSFSVELQLSDVQASNYAYIANIDKTLPKAISPNTYFNNSNSYIKAFFEDALSCIGIPTSTLSTLLDDAFGTIKGSVSTYDERLMANIKVDGLSGFSTDKYSLDQITTGLPFRIQLGKNNNYEGDTPYTVTVSVRYYVMGQINNYLAPQVMYYPFHIDATTTHEGTITLK